MNGKTRYQWVDTLKGLAILLVILVHLNQSFEFPINFLSKLFTIGARGPQLFFIISAYLTWGSLSRTKVISFKTGTAYFSGRLIRLVPTYYIAILLAFILFNLRFVYPEDFSGLWVHLLLINGFFPKWCNNILNVEWYIADLVIFYLLTPFFAFVVKNLRQSIYLTFYCILISIVFLMFTRYYGISQFEGYYRTHCFLIQLPVWALGIVLYYLLEGEEKYLLISVTIAFVFFMMVIFNIIGLVISTSLIAGLFFLWLCYSSGLYEKRKGKVFLPVFPTFGKNSLGIFLFHMFVIKSLSSIRCIGYLAQKPLGWLLLYLFVIALSLGVSIAITKLLSKVL